MIDLTAPSSPPTAAPSYAAWESAGKRQTAQMRRDLNERTAGPLPSFGKMVHYTPMAEAGLNQAYSPKEAEYRAAPIAYDEAGAQDEGYSFSDVIDMINPLQHLPVVGMIYRKLTGDTIKPISNIIGGTIFGGPIGAVSSTVNAIIKDRTGRDLAENAFAMVGFDIAPAPIQKPDIDYVDAALGKMTSANLQNASESYLKTATGARNFAARAENTYHWNA